MQRKAIIAGTVAAALATGGVLAVSGGAQTPAGQTIKLVTKNGKFAFVDNPPKMKGRNGAFSIGDMLAFNSAATDEAGTPVGVLDATATITKAGRTGRAVATGVYALKDGEIHVVTRFSINFSSSAATTTAGSVVGGTGAYAGARGTFVSVDRPGEKNGDPSDDTITLLP